MEIILEPDSETPTSFEWQIRLVDEEYPLIASANTTDPNWSYIFTEYGKYRFILTAKNDVGESEPYPLNIEVYEPIENFRLLPINSTLTENALIFGSTYAFKTEKTLGNNITYNYCPYGIEKPTECFSSQNDQIDFVFTREGGFTFEVTAENTLSRESARMRVIVQQSL